MTEDKELIEATAIDFYTWRDKQEFFYQRLESEVIDYLNEFIDYDTIDALITEDESINWEEPVSEVSEISQDSETFEIVERHINTYITEQT